MLFEIIKNVLVFDHVDECCGCTFITGTTSPTSSVDIVDKLVRSVIVYDMGDVINIDTSSCNRCTNQNVRLASPKGIETFFSLLLYFSSVQ